MTVPAGLLAALVGYVPVPLEARPPAPAQPTMEDARGFRPSPMTVRAPRDREVEAQRMLELIRESVARGDLATAERQLQILEERHPGSEALAEGQRMLSKLQDSARRAAPSPYARPDPGARPPPPPVAVRPDPRPDNEPTTQTWNTQVRRVRALLQDFRASAGDRIFFAEASAELGSRARAVLVAQADWLKRFPHVPVVIQAHADDRGGREFNEDLSLRRGEAVKARLIAEGVDATRIRVVPLGREKPVADCRSSDCAAQNRRALTLIGGAADPAPATRGDAAPRDAPRANLIEPRRP
jgi:peptidoglycan-associated lipoprotein